MNTENEGPPEGIERLLSNSVLLSQSDGSRAAVSPHGAHTLSWTPAHESASRLFLSRRTASGRGASIRGGVPVIFPQFATRGPLPKHGFARTRSWRIQRAAAARVELELLDDAQTRAIWPYAFALHLTVALDDGRLEMALEVENRDDAPFEFTAALHTYLQVAEIEAARLRGLRDCEYLDATDAWARRRQIEEALPFGPELDRVYVQAPAVLHLDDGQRCTRIENSGFADTVVWNPGADKAAALADLEPGGERRFVCVEAAQAQTPLRLAPGARWRGSQTLSCALVDGA